MNSKLKIQQHIQQNFDSLIKYKENRRAHEDIILDIKKILSKTRKDTFLPFILQMLNSVQFRYELESFKNLKSPLKQLTYLIDLFLSIDSSETESAPNEEEWKKLTELLDEVEMTYFSEIGFFKENIDDLELNKISVSLKAFFDYYANGQLSYDEQTLNRLKINFKKFDYIIFEEYAFRTSDIITFYYSVNNYLQNKSNACFHLFKNPEEWKKLTSKFTGRGLHNPQDWLSQPELADMIGFKTRPGYIFILNRSNLSLLEIENETLSNLISFLEYEESLIKNKIFYYSDDSQYLETPIIELNETEFLFPNGKFVLEAFYNRINKKLIEKKKENYSQFKNKMLENKTLDVFKTFFPSDALFFTSFYFDKNTKSEQDLLICYNRTLLIIEIKDFNFRAPMRNPISAFDKIRSDFKGGIQKAYDQCLRLENKIELGEIFKIYDKKKSKELFEIIPKEIDTFYSIIVTQHRYGGIQTNLSELLEKKEGDLYPWSVCIDDLEIFLTGLIKIKKKLRIRHFLEYLDYREAYHERLICGDELEMCGFFINSSCTFKQLASYDDILTTDPRMSDIFDAHYENGLGLPNEVNIQEKRKTKLRKYAKNFDITFISGNDLKI